MAGRGLSNKRALIDKANSTVVIIVSIAVFVTIFSLVATKTLISQATYQNRVIKEKRVAVDQLVEDIEIVKKIQPAYKAFVGTQTNIIGGNATGTGPQDGDNAKIILDALPSRYDFPGLTTNIANLVASQGGKLTAITGTDDEVVQSANVSSGTPVESPMPFQLTVDADYDQVQKTISAFERSIRPIEIMSVDITGNQSKLTMSIKAQSYYQPAKSLKIAKKVVK